MTQLFTGTVVYQADSEPYDSGYGLRYNVAIRPDDPNAPKVREGLIKIYRAPDHSEVGFLRSLSVDDQVSLIYTERGDRSFYNFLITGSPDASNGSTAPQTRPEENATASAPAASQPQVWYPLTNNQIETYETIASQEQRLLSLILHNVNEQHTNLEEDTRWKMTVSIYIAMKHLWRPSYVTEQVLEADPPF